MCIRDSSDIERQFEFVQQNWLNNPCFGGLYDERDPLVSTQPNGGGRFTVQADGVRERIGGIGQYVTTKCGGYFFMPGLSALRYLAHGDAATAPAVSSGAVLAAPPRHAEAAAPASARGKAVQTPTIAYRVLSWAEKVLPKVRTMWAARFPLLLAAALVLLPLLPRADLSFAHYFVVGRWSLMMVSLTASLSAFAALISLRLVLLYGWRSGLRGAQWTGSVTWPKIFAFQLLALPIVWTVIKSSSTRQLDYYGAGMDWSIALELIPFALAGGLAAIGLLLVATSIQSIWRGSRPDLFFPPNPLFKNFAGPSAQVARVSKLAERLTRLGAWIVDSVPEEIGRGYIDYRVRRVLPGHAFAAIFATLVFIGYIAGAIARTVNPGEDAWVPPLAVFLLLLTAVAWVLSSIAFFFDRYHIPIFLPIGAVLLTIELVRRAVAGA